MSNEAKLERVSVVLLGHFNPSIFQPTWFAAHGLIASDEDKVPKGVTLKVAHPEISDFSTEDFDLQVVQGRFLLGTPDVSFYDSLKDLILGTFKILSHTPVIKMGINRDFHFQMPTEAAWNEVGDRLVPKEDLNRVLKNPGMVNLALHGERSDGRNGLVRVRVEPSTLLSRNGILVGVNDHFEVSDPDNVIGCSELIGIIDDVWTDSLSNAERIAKDLVFGDKNGGQS